MTVDVVETRDASGAPLVPEPARAIEKRESRIENPAVSPPPSPTPTEPPIVNVPAIGARIRGRAILEGPIPRRKRIMAPVPNVTLYDESQVVHRENRGIRSVFVYIKKVDGRFEMPRDAVELSFCDWRLGPRVFGARAGQDVAVTNFDRDTQNFHALPKRSKECNFTMPPGQRDVLRFENREVMVALKCDFHPWECAYAGVLDHPYFSVTDDNGAFELQAIGPGEYALAAWHEIYGELVKSVVVADRTDPVEFVFVRR